MTPLKIKSSLIFNRHLSKGLRGTLVLLAASSLFACSQPSSGVSDANTTSVTTENATAITLKEDEPNAKSAHMMTRSVSKPDLLKNVSATVYKDANCGCCKEWISHAEDNGLSATAQDVADLAVFKERYSVPNEMRSCHTVVTTDGYVFEGHVPAKYMAQFLENPPVQAMGLAVPGMPIGSPGMEYQNKFMPYQVMQLNKDGTTQVYADIESVEQQL
ncbi:DUF411 domain-containing protein [Psychrobacter sp. NPDC078370]|uniref:DUF411 domain-containing protein n=2 Tax=Psychrobacter TaxID=497 RepID=A0ABU9XAX9_9GAMM|nr:DUF411 domain-containing protein [Psychrobacter sp. MES7-P7E]PLT23662.1 ATP-binding protein [Psychrobacter sp. MES7-P7E]